MIPYLEYITCQNPQRIVQVFIIIKYLRTTKETLQQYKL